MKLTVQQVMDSVLVISQIIRERRPMPQKGKYRLARMHAKLLPEFTTINAQREEMITAYNNHPMIDVAGVETPSPEFEVPVDKMEEFGAAWKVIGDQEIEVDVEPIQLAYLDMGGLADGSIQASELITLGALVTE